MNTICSYAEGKRVNVILQKASMSADEAYELLADSSNVDPVKLCIASQEELSRIKTAFSLAMNALHEKTNEGLNTALYQKMFVSQEAYKRDLQTQSSDSILSQAYDYVKRGDILLSLEYYDLENEEAKALLSLEDPLSAVFKWYERNGDRIDSGSDLDRAWTAIEECAREILREKK